MSSINFSVIIKTIFKQIFRNIFRFQSYAIAFAPVILVLWTTTDSDSFIQRLFFDVIRRIAIKPEGATLNESDLARFAAITITAIFVIYLIVAKIYKFKPLKVAKFEFLAKVIIGSTAWIVFLFVGDKSDSGMYIVAPLMILVSPVFYYADYAVAKHLARI